MKYSRFEILAMGAGVAAVLGTILSSLSDTSDASEIVGQILILLALYCGVHYGRKGALLGFGASTVIYAAVSFATIEDKGIALQLVLFRAIIYALVAFAAGELNVRLKYLFTKLEHHDYVDDITSLYNTKYLGKLVEKYISEFDRYGSKFSLANFTVNERIFEHMKKKTRDKMIKDIGNSVIRGNIRGADEAARIDGASFTVLFPNTNYDGATYASIRIKGKIASYLDHHGISSEEEDAIGADIVEYPRDKDSIEQLSANLVGSPVAED